MIEAHLIYALAWCSFGIGHSLLASASLKSRLGSKLGAYYRLSYNLFASLHILVVWLVGYKFFANISSFELSADLQRVLTALIIIGVIILVIALKTYDLGRFAGTHQIRNQHDGIVEDDVEPLKVDGLHAYVRHPLYLGAYLILWGGAQDDFGLATALWGSLYLVIGSKFEERRLLATYGDAYQRYLVKVPAVIPWRGKAY